MLQVDSVIRIWPVLEAVTDLARKPFQDKAAASVLLATDVCLAWDAGESPACVHRSADGSYQRTAGTRLTTFYG
jgi:hypothetical protein